MALKLLPIIDIMIGFYQLPATPGRFNTYIKMLEGEEKGSLSFPVSGFNPMAKGHVLDKLKELKDLAAEKIMEDTIEKINKQIAGQFYGKEIKVGLNLSDDLKGGWTNRFTSDYDSKFRISGLAGRNFCISLFWASDQLTAELIRQRTAEYIFRTIYRMNNPQPLTLHQHITQESFVAQEAGSSINIPSEKLAEKERFYLEHKDSREYAIIFNFFYGDKASEALSFSTFGNNELVTGFDFAATRVCGQW